MSSAPAAFSARFARAAEAERDRLEASLERAKAKARKRRAERALGEARAALPTAIGEPGR
jgi:hypothetical protein